MFDFSSFEHMVYCLDMMLYYILQLSLIHFAHFPLTEGIINSKAVEGAMTRARHLRVWGK